MPKRKGTLGDVLEAVKGVKEDVKGVKEDVKGVKEDVKKQDTKVDGVNTKIDGVNTKIEEMDKRLGGMGEVKDAVESQKGVSLAASDMSEADLMALLRSSKIEFRPAEGSPKYEEFNFETAARPTARKWARNLAEHAQRPMYILKLQDLVDIKKNKHLEFTEVANSKFVEAECNFVCRLSKKMGTVTSLRSKNDELLHFSRRMKERYSVAGFEMKKRLQKKHIFEAYVEFLLYSTQSRLPYVQFLTDLDVSVAMYVVKPPTGEGGPVVEYRIFSTWEELKIFMDDSVKRMPTVPSDDGVAKWRHPDRHAVKQEMFGLLFAGAPRGNGGGAQQADLVRAWIDSLPGYFEPVPGLGYDDQSAHPVNLPYFS